ncbi:MAG: hypothetical protein ABII96_01260 [Candidatus Zixiibacteriota bacterium]
MGVKSFIRKVIWYHKKHGWLKLTKLSLERIWWHLNDKGVMYYLDLSTMEVDKSLLRENVFVESYEKMQDIPLKDIEILTELKSKEILMVFLKRLVDRGATLWLTKEDGKLVNVIWTLVGGLNGYYEGLPIVSSDVIFLAGETFPEYRGRSILRITISLVCLKLKERGISRVYSVPNIKNDISVRSQSKVLKRMGTVRSFGFFKWYIAIWDKKM